MGFLKDGLKKLVFKEDFPQIEPGNYKAKVISITARKGGVGKTTLAVNIATTLSLKFNKKVLLVDLDPQAHTNKSLEGVIKAYSNETISQIFLEKRRELLEISVPTGIENLYLVRGDQALSETENLLNTKIGKEFILSNTLNITRTHFDLIIIDTPPNLGNLTVNSLVASDFCIIPLDLSTLAIQGVQDIAEAVLTIRERLNRGVNILGLIINRFDKRLKSTNTKLLKQIEEDFGELLFKTYIPTSSAIPKSQLHGKPLPVYDKKSPVNRAFYELSEEIQKRISLF